MGVIGYDDVQGMAGERECPLVATGSMGTGAFTDRREFGPNEPMKLRDLSKRTLQMHEIMKARAQVELEALSGSAHRGNDRQENQK